MTDHEAAGERVTAVAREHIPRPEDDPRQADALFAAMDDNPEM